MTTKGTIAVVGAGAMGTAIATLCAAHGYKVVLNDNNEGLLKSFPERAAPAARSFTGSGRTHKDILSLVETSASLEHSVREAFLVQETIHEDLGAKRALFQQLDEMCADNIMLATNTSSFLLTDICQNVRGRHRVLGIHYVAPAHLVRAVEIIVANFTDQGLIQRARQFLESIDHVGIVCGERPGFLINRIQYALKAEVHRMVDEGVASVEDIDAAVRLAIGPRLALWGPMMQEDLSTSKTTVLAVTEYIRESTGQTHYAGSRALHRLAESGQNGAAAGAGWYKWDANNSDRVTERDRQLGELLDWLRKHDRVDALGAKGENTDLREALTKSV